MYVIFNRIKVKKEHLDEFLAGIREHARNSNSEPGCVRYDVLQDMDDPTFVFLYEAFTDEAAFRQHQTHDYYKRWMESSKDWRYVEGHIRHVLDYIYPPEDG
jgi:autoinducer 2-degrading protein